MDLVYAKIDDALAEERFDLAVQIAEDNLFAQDVVNYLFTIDKPIPGAARIPIALVKRLNQFMPESIEDIINQQYENSNSVLLYWATRMEMDDVVKATLPKSDLYRLIASFIAYNEGDNDRNLMPYFSKRLDELKYPLLEDKYWYQISEILPNVDVEKYRRFYEKRHRQYNPKSVSFGEHSSELDYDKSLGSYASMRHYSPRRVRTKTPPRLSQPIRYHPTRRSPVEKISMSDNFREVDPVLLQQAWNHLKLGGVIELPPYDHKTRRDIVNYVLHDQGLDGIYRHKTTADIIPRRTKMYLQYIGDATYGESEQTICNNSPVCLILEMDERLLPQ